MRVVVIDIFSFVRAVAKSLLRHSVVLISATFAIMKITIVAATRFEIDESLLQNDKHQLRFLYTGVGMLSSAVSLTQHVIQYNPELMIQAGIAGCFDYGFALGKTVAVENESPGDTGVSEEGLWKDLFDMKLLNDNEAPYTNRHLVNESIDKWNTLQLPKVNGVTVNQITGSEERREVLRVKYNADIESMEGAALHYVCRLFSIPFLQVRSLSNYVGERNKKNWKMKESIMNVNEAVRKLIINYE